MLKMDAEKNIKKEVTVKIKGIHKNIDSNTKEMSFFPENMECSEWIENIVETEYKGFYQKIDEQVYIKYIEKVDTEIVSSHLLKINTTNNKIDNSKIEMIQKGVVNSKMTFIEKMETKNIYSTPYGKLNMAINTESIDINVKEEMLLIMIKYDLIIDSKPVSKCKVEIIIQP